VMPGYIERRQLERTTNAPGVASRESEALDVAAVWFDEDVLDGGFGGYLVSGANGTNYVEIARQAMLTGYPVERSDGLTNYPGRLYWLEKISPVGFSPVQPGDLRLYETADFLSFPGNSGGPLLVPARASATAPLTYFPAGVYLGTTGTKSRVRLIDTNVLELINTAASAANLGTNFTGGGAINLVVVGGSNFATAGLNFSVGPPEALAAGGGWRILGLRDYTNFTSAATGSVRVVVGVAYTLEFREAPGWIAPTNLTLNLPAGQTNSVAFVYAPAGMLPLVVTNPASVNAIAGETVRFRVAATGTAPLDYCWQKNSQTLAGATNTLLTLSNVTIANAGSYRVVVHNPVGSVTSAPAVLTITMERPTLGYGRTNGLWLSGPVGRSYQIQEKGALDPLLPWTLRQRVLLTNSPARVFSPPTNPPSLFFRALLEGVP
ncbi:MAG TPA: immunoglobulin domain-containing protein, partial [Verrucomicrobiae bacterium]